MMKGSKFFKDHELTPSIAVVVGTRPGIVMFAPIIHELRRKGVPHFVIHTGQHYSPQMDAELFEDLELPRPEFRLEGVAGKVTHGAQTAAMLEGIERALIERKPAVVLVGGDANTNLAGALAARKLHLRVGHVEAGERSYDWRMPEEHNRIIIDHISEYLFATGTKAVENLKADGVRGTVVVTGNPIVDASRLFAVFAKKKPIDSAFKGLTPGRYGVMTMHREENVDVEAHLRGAFEGVSAAATALGLPIVFLAHPRTRKRLLEFGLEEWASSLPGIQVEDAVRYIEFVRLLIDAKMVFTDSGGVQQEACIHHIPCVTLRENTEWIETLTVGANRLGGVDPARIKQAALEAEGGTVSWDVPFGDGDAAEKIVQFLVENVPLGRLSSDERVAGRACGK